MEHDLNSYCSRAIMARRSSRNRRSSRSRRSRSPSSSSDTSSEEGEVSSALGEGSSNDYSGSEEGEVVENTSGEKVEEIDPLKGLMRQSF